MSKLGAPSRWPAHCRIYRVLRESKKQLVLLDIAKLACVADQTAGRALIELRSLGLAHIAKWRRTEGNTGGAPAAMWVYGYGVDAPKPTAYDEKTCKLRHYHKKKEKVIDRFGHDIWKRMRLSRREGGADVISKDGYVIYRRQPAAQKVAA